MRRVDGSLPDWQGPLRRLPDAETIDDVDDRSTPPVTLVNFWDRQYEVQPPSALDDPHPALLELVRRIPVGTALDVGCGAGVNAVWLATLGWRVTGIDVSAKALRRAETNARRSGVEVRWVHSRLEDLPSEEFDLVSAQYPALLSSPAGQARDTLLRRVGALGALLVVHHADVDAATAKSHGFDPDDYLGHHEMAGSFDDGWQVSVERDRLRPRPAGEDGADIRDHVVLARRLP